MIAMLATLLTAAHALAAPAAPAAPIQNETLKMFCRGVVKGDSQALQADFEEVTVQTSKGPRVTKVLTRLQASQNFKFLGAPLQRGFLNLANGECGFYDRYFDPANQGTVYTEIAGDVSVQLVRNWVTTSPGIGANISVHNLITPVLPSCAVYALTVQRVGTLNAFRTQLPADGKILCAK